MVQGSAKVAHFSPLMCGPKFCSIKITQDARNCAATLNEQKAGMAEMSANFTDMGSKVCLDAEGVTETQRSFGLYRSASKDIPLAISAG